MWSRNTATASHNLQPKTKGMLSEIMLIADKSGPGINLTTLLGPIYSSILLLIQLRIQIFYSADMAPDPCCFKIFLGRASFHLNACLLFKLQQLARRARRRFFKNNETFTNYKPYDSCCLVIFKGKMCPDHFRQLLMISNTYSQSRS